ncbi:hypothetical protein ABZ896_05445 [Streptomyces sp. NPDC047072]|uniref:hypothetical protein n=1 Tax=Streptomyces sp. NPDC047072 TaxID=3154809 RepID=UPI003410B3AA
MADRPAPDREHPADRPDHYDVRTHAVSGQVVVGRHNTVSQATVGGPPPDPVTDAELAVLRAEFARLRELVPADAPDAGRARELLDEVEESATAPEPDLTTMEYALGWFRRRLPELASAVTSLLLHPVTVRLLDAAGTTVAEDFRRRLGGG